MARPRKASLRVATPERLLGAAEREFALRGFAAARLEDIAERSGITRPSLLHHYASKEALYSAVVKRSFGDLGRALQTAPSPSSVESVDWIPSAGTETLPHPFEIRR